MNCPEVRPLLHLLVDGALPGDLQTKVTNHISACSSCTREIEDLRSIQSLMEGLAPLQARPGFVGQVATRIAREKPKPLSEWGQLLANAFLAIMGLLGAAMIVLAWRDMSAIEATGELGEVLIDTEAVLTPIVALDSILVDPLDFLQAAQDTALTAADLLGGQFMLGATLVLLVCFVVLFELLAARPRERLPGGSL